MHKLPRSFKAASLALASLSCLALPALSQELTGGVSTTDMTGGAYDNNLGQTTDGIAGPVGIPQDTASDAYLFQLPNFEGDTREPDLYYYLHPYNYDSWDTYRQELYQYAANARQQMSQGWPPPPYSVYNYAGSIATGTGFPIDPPAGATGTLAPGGSGVTVNANGGGITNAPSTAGENSGLGGAAITSVSGQVVQPPTIDPPPATIEPLRPIGQTPGWTGM